MLSNCGAGEDSLRVPWTARRPNQSTLKEINPEYSWEEMKLSLVTDNKILKYVSPKESLKNKYKCI